MMEKELKRRRKRSQKKKRKKPIEPDKLKLIKVFKSKSNSKT
jgi:hypothetical protein